jgi:hypothetical protein
MMIFAANKQKPVLKLKLGGSSQPDPETPAPRPISPERQKIIDEFEADRAAKLQGKIALQVQAHEEGKQEMKRKASAMIQTLVERFPRCFSSEAPRPLKIGIDQDIRAQMPNASATDLRNALKAYVITSPYLAASSEGADRVDLNGAPCGVVTAGQARWAQVKLQKRRPK